MGCTKSTVKEDPIVRLNKLRSQVMSTIEINKIKISKLEQDIQNFDTQIKQGENDIKQNQYSYSDLEKKAKVKKLMEYQKDRQRAQANLDKLSAYNETLKSNLSNVESKIEEIRNNMQFREGNEIMNQLGDLDTGDILQENIQNIMRQQQQDMQNLRILENGNNAINANLGIKNEDDYLKSLLGTAGAEAAPAY
jgi:DNA repair exonuclease SbcCD ATPase subunit